MGETYEGALARTESDAVALQRAADAVGTAAKRVVAATKLGDAGAIDKALADARAAEVALRQQLANTVDGWTFNLADYTAGGGLHKEFASAAQAAGLPWYEQDARIFSYPALLRIVAAAAPADCVLVVDKKRTKALRPSHVVAQLSAARAKPPKFKATPFLKALYKAYRLIEDSDRAVELLDLYDILVLFPGQQLEYSKQEFARDVALLDASGISETDDHRMRLSASRGRASRLLQVVDEGGHELIYYAISFERRPAE